MAVAAPRVAGGPGPGCRSGASARLTARSRAGWPWPRGGQFLTHPTAFSLLCFRVAIAAIGGKRTCGLCCSTTSSSLPLVAEPRETGQPPTGQANCDTGTTEHGECGQKPPPVQCREVGGGVLAPVQEIRDQAEQLRHVLAFHGDPV